MSYLSPERIAAEVRAEMARQRITVNQLCEDTGIPLATLKRRLAGQYSFTLDELAKVAEHLEIDPQLFFDRAREAEEVA